ncbi:MAG: ABC transporter permease [Actinomycetota bacterium]|nr:ABC transporter permease [Actinomycetota bacterium]
MSLSAVGAPSAIGSDLRRFWNLTWVLAMTTWKLRFYGSVLGYFWSLARPFMLFGVIYLVFVEFANLGAGVPHFAVYILMALVLFQYFGEITTGCLGSLAAREGLLRKVQFPRLVIPLSVALTALFNLGMTLVAVLVFALASKVYPTWSWLQLPVIIAILTLWAVGLGMLLSALYIRFRDIQPIWDVAVQALFYASPVLYVGTLVPASFQHPYHANPLAALFAQMRHAMLDPDSPTAWEAIGGAERLLIPAAIVLFSFAIGWVVFKHDAPRIAENL